MALILIPVVIEKGGKDKIKMKNEKKKSLSKIVYTSSISTSNELFIYHNVNAFEMIFQIIYNAFRCVPVSIYLDGVSNVFAYKYSTMVHAMHVGNIDSGLVLLRDGISDRTNLMSI